MAYTEFDKAAPDASTQNGTQVFQSTLNNLKAIRDACAMGFGFPGWSGTPTGTAPEYTEWLFSDGGTERIKAVLTWTSGNVTRVVYSYSSNSGGAYDQIGQLDITYNGDGYVTGTAWS